LEMNPHCSDCSWRSWGMRFVVPVMHWGASSNSVK
jgi:hypothetical protein